MLNRLKSQKINNILSVTVYGHFSSLGEDDRYRNITSFINIYWIVFTKNSTLLNVNNGFAYFLKLPITVLLNNLVIFMMTFSPRIEGEISIYKCIYLQFDIFCVNYLNIRK